MSTTDDFRENWDEWKHELLNPFGPGRRTHNFDTVRKRHDELIRKYGYRGWLSSNLFIKPDYFPDLAGDTWTMGASLWVTENFASKGARCLGPVDLEHSDLKHMTVFFETLRITVDVI